MVKTCRKCGVSKPLPEFYKHSGMANGRLSFCAACVRDRVAKHRKQNLERVREYDRNRPNAAERHAKHLERSKMRGYGKGRKIRGLNPLKDAARDAVNNAVRDGTLKVLSCERCGYGVGVHGHHEDYSKPLDVVWLCSRCHGQRHREINAERRRSAA